MPDRTISFPRLPFSKIIRDCIHGYIQLTPIEYKLIQLPALNRLHNIKQLSTAYMVYPCAKGSRFEHSLGVMHIASRMINQVLGSTSPEELKKIFDLNVRAPTKFRIGYCDLIQKVRLAALLHDIGHGPFSHLSEEILHKAVDKEEAKEAIELFNCEEEKISFHEYFSYKMITSDSSKIKKIIEESTKIKAIDIGNLLIGKNSESISDEGTGIVKKLISSQLDADRMDYLLRDAHSTGVTFGQLDIDRVIMNLCLRKDKTKKYEIAVHERALMNIEDIIDARFKMYKWVYNHHLIVALNRLLLNALESMIESKELALKDFHWTAFLHGKTDENFIQAKLIEYQKSEFKGLNNRQYAPLPY
jgi:HD superfamily phosphohydrolase